MPDRQRSGRRSRLIRALAFVTMASVLSLLSALVVGSSASAAHYPECNSVLEGPQGGTKTATVTSVNADGSVTMKVVVTFPDGQAPKPGQHVFDCVFDGAAAKGSVVGSTGTPGADCSQQGLACTFSVTTEPLSAGSHELCDIAKFEGFQSDSPDHSGDRTPEVCVTANVPPGPSPTPKPSTPATPSPSPSAGSGSGSGSGSATAPEVPGLPNTGLWHGR